jgi:hypothetical protein
MLSCRSGGLAPLEALPAEYRAPLSRPERNCGFAPALRADGGGFDASRRTASFGRAALPFGLTIPAALRLVPEFFFVIKLLLARGEDKIRTAIDALEYPVLKVAHGTILDEEDGADAIRLVC